MTSYTKAIEVFTRIAIASLPRLEMSVATIFYYHEMVIYVQEEEEDPYYLSEADIKWLFTEEEEVKKKKPKRKLPSIKKLKNRILHWFAGSTNMIIYDCATYLFYDQ